MQQTASILKKGGIAIIPTDTLYGIVASAFAKPAVERIYTIKGRDENKPFIVLIASVLDLKKFDIVLSSAQKKILTRLWPNATSVILPCPHKKFEYLHRGTRSLAFRLPKNKKIQELLKKTGPLVAPSANPQGMSSAETIDQARTYFGNAIDMYISGGHKKGSPSTIVRFGGDKLVILRQGKTRIPKALLSLEK